MSRPFAAITGQLTKPNSSPETVAGQLCTPRTHRARQINSAALSAPANTKETNPTMPNTTRGVGLFTAENIVAAIRAIPDSDGTYRDVASKAAQYGGNFRHHTLSNWVKYGRADVAAGQPSTAYARFTKQYQALVDEHCRPDSNRSREFDRALEILKGTCECGNDKMLMPDGRLGSTCQECQDLDTRQRRQPNQS